MRSTNSGSCIPSTLLLLKYLLYMVSAIWGARNLNFILYAKFRLSCVKKMWRWYRHSDTNLISGRGAHEPIIFKEEFDPTRNGRRIIQQFVKLLDVVFYMIYILSPHASVFLIYLR